MIRSIKWRRDWWPAELPRLALGLAAATLLPLGFAQAPLYKTDLTFGLLSQKDPHPLTYTYGADIQQVKETGPYFYYFYYTGEVGPDARVAKESKVQRVAIRTDEWANEKKYLLAKLTYFYQVSNNLPATALNDLQSGPQATSPEVGGAPGQPIPGTDANGQPVTDATGAAVLPTPAGTGDATALPPPTGPGPDVGTTAQGTLPPPVAAPAAMYGMPATAGPMPMGPTMGMGAFPGMNGYGFGGANANFGGNSNLNPRVAAEWTLYLDQFVLWEYYCSRNLLKDTQDSLIDPEAIAMATAGQPGSSGTHGGLSAGHAGAGGPRESASLAGGAGALGSNNVGGTHHGQGGFGAAAGVPQTPQQQQLAALAQPGLPSSQDQTGAGHHRRSFGGGAAGANAGGTGGGGVTGVGSFIDSQSGDFYGQHGAGSTMPGLAGPAANNPAAAALREQFDLTNMEQTSIDWRDKFVDAARENEQKQYKAYLEMINRIDQRQVNQEQYEQWIDTKRQQIYDFAENWRKLDEGEAQVIGDTMFLVTQEPLENPPYNSVNVIKAERVTPQDLLNADGTTKKPPDR